ncbi:CST complex subunit Ten1 [Colletotrichum navitas]|uniref:CST complex subunit Ten1 n=1 Tax=Colletotrichum navitas TaxID=681940 RepID=A0AAD8V3F1_9PEZI|nr:CST complex subunit Ten1 [Colletotrichum navitas]KAK1584830.1 CST complex subunit Ten1 [Colletotrichum navitas]
MSRGPLPSQLCLLSDLPLRSPGDKVRFMGCVTSYSTHSAVLTLEHSFPKGSHVTALVDVQLLLGTIKPNQTQIGEWVNVVGYVTPLPPGTRAKGTTGEPRKAAIQALMLWSTGPLDLQRYESTFTIA